MVNLFFFLKFKSQLRKTRTDIVRQIDESLASAITNAGGKITGDRFVISAVFNEDTIGFWLDMYIMIEGLKKNIEVSKELFGYSLVISVKYPDSPEFLCRFLSSYSGVFVDDKAARKLMPYASFEEPSEWIKKIKKRKYSNGNLYKVKELKTFKLSGKNELNYQNEIIKIYEQEKSKNVLILGPSYWQIRGGLYKYVSKINGNFPALSICFESIGLGAVVDIWSLSIRSIAGSISTEEIDTLWDFLYRERIRDEISDYVKRCAKKFLLLVLKFYNNAAIKKKKTPVLMLENVHLAEKSIINLLLEVLTEINQGYNKLQLLGTGDAGISTVLLKQCDSVFDTIKKIKNTKTDSIHYPPLSNDLWEIIYALSLFSRYFSPEFFQQLFEEDKKNPEMISRAFSILHTLDIIDKIHEPRLLKLHYTEHVRQILEVNTDRVKTLVCERLLDWAKKRNINPCYRLLSIIHALEFQQDPVIDKPAVNEQSDAENNSAGITCKLNNVKHPDTSGGSGSIELKDHRLTGTKKIDDILLLKTLSSDIVNNTVAALNTAMNDGDLDYLVPEKADVIRQIYKTSITLYTGEQNIIESAFNDPALINMAGNIDVYPVLNSQIIVNHCAYYLGQHDDKKATAKAKEAILLGQGKNNFSLPQSYRLYSLVCLSRQRINETIEYLGFALTNAERNDNYHELAVSSYYAAAAQFLYGDIYKALQFVGKSIKYALDAGSPDWADRACFLQGRIEFELGRYREAYDVFDKINKEPYDGMFGEKENLLSAWIYRCKNYFQRPEASNIKSVNHDIDLFEIEGAYLCGDYEKVVELSSSYVNPFEDESFLYIERADWRSGFTQCEHLYFGHGEIQNRMVSLFHSLALSKLSKEPTNDNDDAIQCIQKILRDDRLCEMDPWESFYFFAKYIILERFGASSVDMSTAVSMAFKRLQRRACRIEDVTTRHQYLNGPRWNRELCQAAKEFKLI